MESRPWGAAIKAATKEQIKRREVDASEVVAEKHPPRSHIGNDNQIEYMDANGEFRDEISNKKLDSNGVNLPDRKKSDNFNLMECTRKPPWRNAGSPRGANR